MTLEPDWNYMKKPLIIFSVAAALCLSVLGWAYAHLARHADTYTKITRQIRQQKAAIRQHLTDTATLKKYLHTYARLKQRGALNSEHRLAWINSFRRAVQQLKLRSARYRLAARQEVTKYFGISAGNVQLYASTMAIDVELLHEGDLLSLLAVLRKAPGLFNAASCSLRAKEARIVFNAQASNVVALCHINWYTFVIDTTENRDARQASNP